MPTSKKNLRQQKWWLLLIAASILLAFVLSTWLARGSLGFGEEDEGYQNITLTDAILTCEKRIPRDYQHQLRHVTLDHLSSRYDSSMNRYRIFFTATYITDQSAGAPSKPVLVSCAVDAKRGKIQVLELFEKKENAAEPIKKRDGGIFGWP